MRNKQIIAIDIPSQVNLPPRKSLNAPGVASLVFRPSTISTKINGTDQRIRNIAQPIRKEPPPFWATILGKRQILPVPTAMLIAAIM